MIDYYVLGSGISGTTISNHIAKKNSVEILDKAKGIGGRASHRRYFDNLGFDHGLQYISPKSKKFTKFITTLERKKIIKKWDGKHISSNKTISKKYIGKYGNNDISKYLSKNIKINFNTNIKKIRFNKNYWEITLDNKKILKSKNLILTCPYPQTISLAKKFLNKKMLQLRVKMVPIITLMLVYKKKNFNNISSIKFNSEIISFAAYENSKKRFNSNAHLWTIQSNIKWAKKFINVYKKQKKNTQNILSNEFNKILGIKNNKIIFKNIHGWKFAYNNNKTTIKSFWSKKYKLGICGDWFLGPKAEDAWTSAKDLIKKLS
ncbi:NAD(P)-binding protein [Pelagibacteraceae bacterium]|nr:NAD(P)-binding protein [Pelagibacteraceae bacterium]